LSGLDKTSTRCFYEIEIDHSNNLPKAVKMYVLTGVKGSSKDKNLENERHVSFIFDYSFNAYNQVAQIDVPKAAQKLLR
jgi:hypothetical protein